MTSEISYILNIVTTSIQYTSDIIHMHIYPYILCIIIHYIPNNIYIQFVNNIGVIIISHNFMLFTHSMDAFNKTDLDLLLRIWNICKYILLLEFFAYMYHRLVHTPIFKNFHTHSLESNLYIKNYIITSKPDIIARTLYFHIPVRIVSITYYDFMCVYMFYIYFGYINYMRNFYNIHIVTKKYNYALLFPIYDIIFGTYLSREKYTNSMR